MATRNRSPGCDGSEAACVGARQRSEPRWAERLPDGLYVRDGPGDDDRERAQDRPSVARVRQWSITGRNPDFGWDIVVTDLGANLGGFALHCTKYGDRDHALSLDDVLRLIRAGTPPPTIPTRPADYDHRITTGMARRCFPVWTIFKSENSGTHGLTANSAQGVRQRRVGQRLVSRQ